MAASPLEYLKGMLKAILVPAIKHFLFCYGIAHPICAAVALERENKIIVFDIGTHRKLLSIKPEYVTLND